MQSLNMNLLDYLIALCLLVRNTVLYIVMIIVKGIRVGFFVIWHYKLGNLLGKIASVVLPSQEESKKTTVK